MLQLKNISKSYTTGDFTQTALDKVTLNFRKSEFVAIFGQSGSGKTTFLNVIGGLDKYESGDLIINGKSTKHFKDSDWDAYRNNSIGFIFQSYNLITHLNIVDNVELGMTLSGVSAGEKHKKAIEVLERVGLKEHLHKKPNQLSGGQMQRVAIARAIANNPDIILADEPTGALDSHTSEQIMKLIKEIAEDKLVIMVTHNAELAEKYADRVVNFKDGQITSDSNPLADQRSMESYQLKKTSMGFLTALKLSGKNIITKKWRTTLTAIASSIGIIGIALVLALSNGFDKQITSFETGTLSNFPLTINQSSISMDVSHLSSRKRIELESFPGGKIIYPYSPGKNSVIHTNILTDEYIKYLENIDPSLLDGISFTRSVDMNLLKSNGETATTVNTGSIGFTSYPGKPGEAIGSYLEKYYDLLDGKYPTEINDLVLVVDEHNRVNIAALEALGIDYDVESISFDNLIGYEMKLIMNDDYYKKSGDYFTVNGVASNLIDLYNNDNAVTLKITGIIRAFEDSAVSLLSPGVAYCNELAEYFINDAKKSEIVLAQQTSDFNVLTGEALSQTKTIEGMSARMPGGMTGGASGGMPGAITGMPSSVGAQSKDDILASLGATAIPTSISLYPVNFDAKEAIIALLDDRNKDVENEDRIEYTDMAAMVTSLSGGIMSAITMVLVAFAAISLVVSLIMIAIITYISVLERTTEIGVLRALGARKKDITRVFNAETFIIGSLSGLLGIGIAFLLTFPINIILKNLTELSNIAQINPLHAILLIVISVTLTMLGGSIPAKMAAKKDPVAALRSE